MLIGKYQPNKKAKNPVKGVMMKMNTGKKATTAHAIHSR